MAALSKAIDRNPIVPILELYHIQPLRNALKITASNSQTEAVLTVPAKCEPGDPFTAPPQILETLQKLPDGEAELTVKDCEVVIKADRKRYKSYGENAEDFPEMQSAPETSLTYQAYTLLDAIKYALFCASSDEMRAAMTGVLLTFGKGNIMAVATDSHRLAKTGQTEGETALLSARSCRILMSILNRTEPVNIGLNGSNAVFQTVSASVSCRLLDERFPDWGNVIPTPEAFFTVSKEDIEGALKRLDIYSNKSTNLVRFEKAGDGLKVSSENLDFATEAEEEINAIWSGDLKPEPFGVSAKLLIEIVAAIQSSEITIGFCAPEKPLLIADGKPEKDGDFYLLMPVMLTSYTPAI